MIYQFRIISDEIKDFAREILVNGSNTFLDFHHALQENLGYDPDQLSSFFLTSTEWEKEKQITLIDMMDDVDKDVITMDMATIADHVDKEGQRMLYVFDFFSERSFFIELTDVIDQPDNKALPKVTFANGEPPPQIDLGFDDLGIEDDTELDNEFSGGIDDDDLEEGFEFSGEDDFEE